jgi:hypothetical protein
MGESKMSNQPREKTIRSLHQFINYISRMDLQDDLRQEIIKYASKYPEGALDNIYINIEKIKMKCLGIIAARNNVTINATQEESKATIKAIGSAPTVSMPEMVLGTPKMPVEIKIPEMNVPVIQPPKQKWTTMSAAEVLKQNKELNKKQQIQMPKNPEEEAKIREFDEYNRKLEEMSKKSPEDFKKTLLNELKMNPPREPNNKENEDDYGF